MIQDCGSDLVRQPELKSLKCGGRRGWFSRGETFRAIASSPSKRDAMNCSIMIPRRRALPDRNLGALFNKQRLFNRWSIGVRADDLTAVAGGEGLVNAWNLAVQVIGKWGSI